MEKFMHTRRNGRHFVHGSQLAGPLRIRFDFEARKHAAIYLRINDVLVAQRNFMGNLSAKIAHARELLETLESDAGQLRDMVDAGIARHERKASEARAQMQRADGAADKLRALEL
jgi:hypothetical protein